MVAMRLEKEREILAAEYKVREDVLQQKIDELEGKIRPTSAAATEKGSKKK